jgi:hypothetical protein
MQAPRALFGHLDAFYFALIDYGRAKDVSTGSVANKGRGPLWGCRDRVFWIACDAGAP